MMISGIIKPRNWLNRLLNVTKTLTTDEGRKRPKTTPKAMAMITRGNKPIFLNAFT